MGKFDSKRKILHEFESLMADPAHAREYQDTGYPEVQFLKHLAIVGYRELELEVFNREYTGYAASLSALIADGSIERTPEGRLRMPGPGTPVSATPVAGPARTSSPPQAMSRDVPNQQSGPTSPSPGAVHRAPTLPKKPAPREEKPAIHGDGQTVPQHTARDGRSAVPRKGRPATPSRMTTTPKQPLREALPRRADDGSAPPRKVQPIDPAGTTDSAMTPPVKPSTRDRDTDRAHPKTARTFPIPSRLTLILAVCVFVVATGVGYLLRLLGQ